VQALSPKARRFNQQMKYLVGIVYFTGIPT
jgi:hypothetical protein